MTGGEEVMDKWIEYKFPGIESRSFKKYVDGEASFEFTPGGFLAYTEEAGIPFKEAADAVFFAVNLNQMIALFGVPEVKIGTLNELAGE